MHAGNAFTAGLRAPCRQPFRSYVQTLLGLDSSNTGGASSANHRSPGSWSSQSQQGQRGEGWSNGWRPKRASDRLLQPQQTSDLQSPPQKKKSADCSAGPSSLNKTISVESVDGLAELRAEEHAGRLSSSALQRKADTATNGMVRGLKVLQAADAFLQPERLCLFQKKNSSSSGLEKTSESNRPSSSSTMKTTLSPKKTPSRRQRLDLKEDVMETQRDRWRQFRMSKTRPAVQHRRLKKPRLAPSEPIVLSSEEEQDEEDGDEGQKTSQSSSRPDGAGHSGKWQVSQQLGSPPPSFLQLEFCSLHCGLMEAGANGSVTITENGIMLPVRGTEDTEVTVVASQLRGYGVWDGGVAQGGTLLAGWEGPAPSLLFLWVSEAQANLLQRELSPIQKASGAANAPSCSFLLLVLKEQLQELQAALLASILDMGEYKQRRSSSSPIDWSYGLLLAHSCAPPVDQHLLRLLGPSAKPARSSGAQRNSAGLQLLPTRLLQYPLVPCKGRITVTEEDLACLDTGEFLNDVIIDFYLKYLLLEGVSGAVAQRSHVFSSFFYKQLSRRRAAGESDTSSVPDRHTRHQRVKTWTRHVDIFTKDFLFVPVNQEAHWFLVVVCFPGLEDVRIEESPGGAGGSERAAGKLDLGSQQPPVNTVCF
ncbi:hypothetical protein XENORESO_015149 [Xenotaenia resolanae]|uniref:Ubiquitin-like protease family profile domain-containing protein n=1 Tax=Xenotaenia resolanae TaxID=208358 RepID=A0ABV0VX04_9TELE